MLIRPFPGNTWLVFAPLITAIGVMVGGFLKVALGWAGRVLWAPEWPVEEKGPGQPRTLLLPPSAQSIIPMPTPDPFALITSLASSLHQHPPCQSHVFPCFCAPGLFQALSFCSLSKAVRAYLPGISRSQCAWEFCYTGVSCTHLTSPPQDAVQAASTLSAFCLLP